MSTQDNERWVTERTPFLVWLKEWIEGLPELALSDVIEKAGGAEKVAIICVDVTVGFCKQGPLASPRVGGIVPPIVKLLKLADSLGVTKFALPEDQHPSDSPEFRAYGPHCITGTEETETVPEIKELPFAERLAVLPKQSINAGVDTEFPRWLDEHQEVKSFIAIGDVTDICVYQLATYLKARESQFNLDYEVVVPMDCVDTWDTPVEKAQEIGIMPHDAELLHAVFLYHMALNGVRVVRRIV